MSLYRNTVWCSRAREGRRSHCARSLHAPFRLSKMVVAVLSLAAFGIPVAWGDAGDLVVKTTAPDPLTGRLVSFSLAEGLVIQTMRAEVHVAADELVRITLAPEDEKRNRRAWKMALRNGDTLFGKLKDNGDQGVVFEAVGIGDVELDLSAIKSMELPPAYETAHADTLRWFHETPSRDDQVLLTNGDVLAGFVTRLGAEGVSIDGALGESEVPLRLVVAIRLADHPLKDIEGHRCLVLMRDGSRLTTSRIEWQKDQWRVDPDFAPAFGIPKDRVARLEFAGGRWEWLPDRAPISSAHTPMLGMVWEPRQNRNVVGGSLTVAGLSYDHGIGVHSRSILIFDLEANYDTFVSSFGLDDASGPLADVDVEIRIDGQVRHTTQGVRPGILHGPVRIDVQGSNRIELLVDFGKNGTLQDRFNWIEPALIR